MYFRHRFPAEIISYCVWLYYTFPLSYRDIKKMMLYRGIEVTYEAIREWCRKFGQQYAHKVRRKRPYLTDKWHLDEVVITIKGNQYYLWRAVDSESNVLDILLQRQRHTKAAKHFFWKLLKQQSFALRVIVTDKLKSYEATKNQMLKSVEHRQHKRLNNPCGELASTYSTAGATHAEVQVTWTSATVSCCLWTHSRSLPSKTTSTDAHRYREQMRQRIQDWQEIVGLKPAV